MPPTLRIRDAVRLAIQAQPRDVTAIIRSRSTSAQLTRGIEKGGSETRGFVYGLLLEGTGPVADSLWLATSAETFLQVRGDSLSAHETLDRLGHGAARVADMTPMTSGEHLIIGGLGVKDKDNFGFTLRIVGGFFRSIAFGRTDTPVPIPAVTVEGFEMVHPDEARRIVSEKARFLAHPKITWGD